MITSILLAALLFPLQADKSHSWGRMTVASETSEFSIDIPGKLNYRAIRTRSGAGPGRVVTKGYKTAEGGYLFEALEYRPGMIAGTDNALLDNERDELARQFGGKVTGEKKITLAGGSAGREFTIRGTPKGETGVVNVRVRAYVVGNGIYALMVTSPPDGEPPTDADQFLGSLKVHFNAGAPAKTAAPTASAEGRRPMTNAGRSAAKEQTIAGWGAATDPDGDCKIEADGDALVIEVPNTTHGMIANLVDRSNAPRVLREIEGDFEIQVKVDGNFTPAGPGTTLLNMPTYEAGLVVINDADNFITLLRTASYRNDKNNTAVAVSHRTEARGQGMRLPQIGRGTTYLKLVRQGSKFLPSASSDGETWEALRPVDVKWPGRLKLGVTALTRGAEQPFAITFDELSLSGKEVHSGAGH